MTCGQHLQPFLSLPAVCFVSFNIYRSAGVKRANEQEHGPRNFPSSYGLGTGWDGDGECSNSTQLTWESLQFKGRAGPVQR